MASLIKLKANQQQSLHGIIIVCYFLCLKNDFVNTEI